RWGHAGGAGFASPLSVGRWLLVRCSRAYRAERVGSMPEVWPRRRIDSGNPIAPGDSAQHSHCRFRQAIALPTLRKSECEGDAQAYATPKGFLMLGPARYGD